MRATKLASRSPQGENFRWPFLERIMEEKQSSWAADENKSSLIASKDIYDGGEILRLRTSLDIFNDFFCIYVQQVDTQ